MKALENQNSSSTPNTIMRRLKLYLQQHKQATLGDIAIHFDLPSNAIQGMLEAWIRKGCVHELHVRATCNLVCPLACDDTSMIIYEWQDLPLNTPQALTAEVAPQFGAPVGSKSCWTAPN